MNTDVAIKVRPRSQTAKRQNRSNFSNYRQRNLTPNCLRIFARNSEFRSLNNTPTPFATIQNDALKE